MKKQLALALSLLLPSATSANSLYDTIINPVVDFAKNNKVVTTSLTGLTCGFIGLSCYVFKMNRDAANKDIVDGEIAISTNKILTDAVALLEETRKENAELKAELNTIQKKIANTHSMPSDSSKLDATQEELLKKIDQAKIERQRMQTAINLAEANHDGLRKTVEDLQRNNKELHGKYDELKGELRGTKVTTDYLTESFDGLKKSVAEHDKSIDKLIVNHHQIEEDFNAIKKDLEAHKAYQAERYEEIKKDSKLLFIITHKISTNQKEQWQTFNSSTKETKTHLQTLDKKINEYLQQTTILTTEFEKQKAVVERHKNFMRSFKTHFWPVYLTHNDTNQSFGSTGQKTLNETHAKEHGTKFSEAVKQLD